MILFPAIGWNASPPPYVANAVHFDGDNDWLERTSAVYTGTSSKGIISVFLKAGTQDSTILTLLDASQDKFIYFYLSSGELSAVIGDYSEDGHALYFYTEIDWDGSDWKHVLISWDTAFAIGNKLFTMHIDGVDASPTLGLEEGDSFSLDYSDVDNIFVGSENNGLSKYPGDMAELYFAPGQWLDFNDPANIEKFYKDGKPVYLGSDGSLPTGVAPAIYLNGDYTDFHVNRGTGGDFTVNGSLTAASSSPSD